jgi:F-type H+/Na+-transporting ATPase subunit alpha
MPAEHASGVRLPPSASYSIPYNYTKKSSFLKIALSSTWSGHCPFTAEKGVRAPQGSLLNGSFAPKRFMESFYSLFFNYFSLKMNFFFINNDIQENKFNFDFFAETNNFTGSVIAVADGVVRVDGLNAARSGELVEIDNDGVLTNAIVLNLEPDQICALLLDSDTRVRVGNAARSLGVQCGMQVGYHLLGRVINPLGEALDDLDSLEPISEDDTSSSWYLLERDAPGIIDRKPVDTPVETGLKVVDALFPIGRGQRELIVGDRQTGKTSIAVDAIINQCRVADLNDESVYCIYVSVGQKLSSLVRIVETLKREGVMERCVIVSANASSPAALQYLAPYAGCSVGEFFRDQGDHAIVVYDDLTKHANAYRQISLILRRPPGREAYPGDVFYLHSRLLERAAMMSDENGAGSLTALPIVETQAGDLSGYIPTNVISITDGQIVTDTELFQSGFRPAVNIGLSVSRVGGNAQNKNFKKIAAKFKRSLNEYREVASFAQFGSEVDEVTAQLLRYGSRLNALLAQPNNDPMPVEKQILVLYAATEGYFTKVDEKEVLSVQDKFLTFSENSPVVGPLLYNAGTEFLSDDFDPFISFYFSNLN